MILVDFEQMWPSRPISGQCIVNMATQRAGQHLCGVATRPGGTVVVRGGREAGATALDDAKKVKSRLEIDGFS